MSARRRRVGDLASENLSRFYEYPARLRGLPFSLICVLVHEGFPALEKRPSSYLLVLLLVIIYFSGRE